MREIKFRGKRVDNGGWVYGYFLYSAVLDEHVIWTDHDYWIVVPESVGQYTGLHDNTKWDDLIKQEQHQWLQKGKTQEDWKGKEIYEGDIVAGKRDSHWHGGYDIVRGKVYFSDSHSSFHVDGDGCLYYVEEIEVIGNIYEHPELLEEAQ
ncbi:YopX family protein [Brevibacillus halotolerans]|uniref:YopX family protein n=1 Tax=Brevibacillus halotolerans TaxID=1507437 RepID=UPI0015EFAD56|nr:YopX family protein [Brevibacillus halotolerans]MBA4535125.1 hypothetical protein [Brevibacillus halotolerans]